MLPRLLKIIDQSVFCNVAYKIIAKSLADRIRNHLPHIIHPSQAAFIQGRHITSNIIIAQEIIHNFNLKSWNQKAFFLKLDLAKAFDMIEWNFIVSALKRQGFKDHFIELIYSCISTTTMSVIINGEPTPSFHPRHGVRQGCPLSPYLFIIAVNELSICLQQHSNAHNIKGITLGPDRPRIHSLLFADDLIICGQANYDEASKINTVLQFFVMPQVRLLIWLNLQSCLARMWTIIAKWLLRISFLYLTSCPMLFT